MKIGVIPITMSVWRWIRLLIGVGAGDIPKTRLSVSFLSALQGPDNPYQNNTKKSAEKC